MIRFAKSDEGVWRLDMPVGFSVGFWPHLVERGTGRPLRGLWKRYGVHRCDGPSSHGHRQWHVRWWRFGFGRCVNRHRVMCDVCFEMIDVADRTEHIDGHKMCGQCLESVLSQDERGHHQHSVGVLQR